MKGEKARLDWREGRRRRAWERKAAGWKQQDIAAALGVTPGAVSQWLKRARRRGGGRAAAPSGGRPHTQTATVAARTAACALGPWGRGLWLSGPGVDVQAGG